MSNVKNAKLVLTNNDQGALSDPSADTCSHYCTTGNSINTTKHWFLPFEFCCTVDLRLYFASFLTQRKPLSSLQSLVE